MGREREWPTLNSAVLAQFGIFFQLTLQKHLCPPLSSLGLIIVTRSSQAALGHLLEKLGKVQNSAARLVLKADEQDHVSPLLRTLHWLPIQARIEHKLSTLCHSFFSDTAPVYLSDLLCVYSPSRQLRSSSDPRTLCIPHIKTKTFGHLSFSHAAPSVWNSLPHDIRHIQSITAFKTALKTHLFKSYLCELNLCSLHLFL